MSQRRPSVARPQTVVRAHPSTEQRRQPQTDWTAILIGLIGLVGVAGVAIGFGIHAGVINDDISRISKSLKSNGFLVILNETRSIPTAVATTLTGWTIDGGFPAFDESKGSLDRDTGVFTIRTTGIYSATASVCWTAGTFGVRQTALVTNGNPLAIPTVAAESLISGGCANINAILRLFAGDTLEVQVFRSTAGIEVVTPPTLFSSEQIH